MAKTSPSPDRAATSGSVYRAEVVGSLLRPASLKEAQGKHRSGEISAADLKRVEDRAVDEGIALQENAGLDVVNDGEMRRMTFFDQLGMGLHGIGHQSAGGVTFHGGRPEDDIHLEVPATVVDKIARKRMISVEEFVYARGQTDKPIKVTLPSPLLLFGLWSKEHSSGAYPDPFDLFQDGAQLIREEALELAALGCEYIQIDAPDLCQLADPSQQEVWEKAGISAERSLGEGIDLVNSIAADVPGVRFAIHLCRGNFRSRWISSGGYGEISQYVFKRATNFDTFMLEYDDERSGSFEALRDLADDKIVVLGLISSKVDAVESPEEIVERIDRASEYFARDQLALSTQCGFASIAVGNEVSDQSQQAKLELVAQVAEEVWG